MGIFLYSSVGRAPGC